MESELDFWFPVRRIQRSARSSQGYTFARAPMGLPIRSPTPYSFAESLLQQNEIVMQREDFDPVYRGDVRTMATFYYTLAHLFSSRLNPRIRLSRLARSCFLKSSATRK